MIEFHRTNAEREIDMGRVSFSAIGLLVFLCGTGFAQQFDAKDLRIRNELVDAFTSSGALDQESKLQEVLKIDPENYQVLIKLGELERQRGPKGELAARDYFLRAALAQPHRSEAYLCLADQCYSAGYVPEGTNYMMKALPGMKALPDRHSRISYEAVSLQAQNLLDRCNYQAALMLLGDAALSRRAPFRNDTQLIRKLYQAASLAPAPTLWYWVQGGNFTDHLTPEPWVMYIYAKLVGKDYQEELRHYRKVAREISNQYPRFTPRASEMLIYVYLHKAVLYHLRQLVGSQASIEVVTKERFALSKDFFNFGMCPGEKVRRLDADLDLYDVFVEASVPDKAKRNELVRELKQKRDEALESIAKIQDPKLKGRELFRWLRDNLIKTYDAVDGISAEGVIKDQKYLCLSGAIVYTLFGRDAGLKVNGIVEPGHAYAVLYDAKGKKCDVQTTFPVNATALAPAGFDAPGKARASESGDFCSASPDIIGEVSPVDLVAYQFINVGINKLSDLTLNKFGKEFRAVLEEGDIKGSKVEKFINEWRQAVRDPPIEYMAMLAERNPAYHAQLSEQLNGLLDNFIKARSFSPMNREFLERIESGTRLATSLVVLSPESSMARRYMEALDRRRREAREDVERDMRRYAQTTEEAGIGTASTTSSTSEARDSSNQERFMWNQEKKVWLTSLKRIEKLLELYPCNQRLRAILGRHAINVAEMLCEAKRLNLSSSTVDYLQYEDIVHELQRINNRYFAASPMVSEALSSKMAEL
jgi:hypothetical protein